jgi:hypothetical protein
MPPAYSNPQSQQAIGRWPLPKTARSLESARAKHIIIIIIIIIIRLLEFLFTCLVYYRTVRLGSSRFSEYGIIES